MKKMNRKSKRCCSESEDLENFDSKYTCPNEDNENRQNGTCQNGQPNGNCQNVSENGNRQIEYDEYIENYDMKSMKEIGRTRLEVNDVCYINGEYASKSNQKHYY